MWETMGVDELAPLETWQQVPLALLCLSCVGMMVKIFTTPDEGEDALGAHGVQMQVFGSYFSSLAAPAGAKGPKSLSAVATDYKEVNALVKTLQSATDRLNKEACQAIVEAILSANDSITEAVKANPYVEPVPVVPEVPVEEPVAQEPEPVAEEEQEEPEPPAPPPKPSPPPSGKKGKKARQPSPEPVPVVEEPVVEEPAPVEEEEPEVPTGPSKKTKKKKEKAARATEEAAEAVYKEEPTPEEVMAVVEAAEAAERAAAEAEAFDEPAKQKKKKNRKTKKLEAEGDDEDEAEAEAEAAAEFVPVTAHAEEPAEEEVQAGPIDAAEIEDEAEAEEEEQEEEAEEEQQEAAQPAAEEAAEPEANAEAAAEAAEEGAEEAAEEDEEDEEEEEAEEKEEDEPWEPPPPQPPTQLQKDILKVKKKIREIEELENKQAGGATLSANQLEKVAKKETLQGELEDLENTPEPHTIEWNATVVDEMKPLLGVRVKVEGQGSDKGPFPLLAAHMNPPVPVDDLNSIRSRYPKGADLKVRVLRNGENVSDMSVADEEKRWKEVKRISEKLEEFQKEDERVCNELWENHGTWSQEEYTGVTTSVKDFGVFVLLGFGRQVLVRPDDLKAEWRFIDPERRVARPKRDLCKPGMEVQIRLKYQHNDKKEEDQNYFGSMIAVA